MKELPPGFEITDDENQNGLPHGFELVDDGAQQQQDYTPSPYSPPGGNIPQEEIHPDIQAYEDAGGGFFSSVGRGANRMMQTLQGVNLSGALNNEKTQRALYERTGDPRFLQKVDFYKGVAGDSLKGISDTQRDIQAAPMHPDTRAAAEKINQSIDENDPWYRQVYEGGKAAAQSFAESGDKWGMFKDLAGEQVPVMAATMLGSKGIGTALKAAAPRMAGTLAGEAAVVGSGAGMGSFTSTYGSNVADAIEKGMAPEEATKHAAKRSAIQALVDAGTGAVVPVKFGSQIINLPTQTAIQMIGGGGGEYLAALGVGENPNMADVVLEGVMEAIGLPADIASASFARGEKIKPEMPPQDLALPSPDKPLMLTVTPNENSGETIYARNPQPALPSPEAYPSGQFVADSEGNARQITESEAAGYDQQRQTAQDIGLTPDVVRAQEMRNNPGPRMQEKPSLPAENLGFDTGFNQVKTDPETSHKSAGKITEVDPDKIQVDAKTFQFKEGGDEFGITDRLSGVKEFDPTLSGVGLVYEKKDGSQYIVDGHQRLGLAKRAKAAGQKDVTLPARILREADGITPQQARKMAAFKNIAENSGTSLDAAKVIREGGSVPPTVPKGSAMVRDALGLASLSDASFKSVINDVVPKHYGAMVGRVTTNPQEQEAIIRTLSKAKPSNINQAEIIARDIIESQLARTQTQSTLFGDEQIADSIYSERARILDSALKTLKNDRDVFRTLNEQANFIENEGNVLAREANQQRQGDAERMAQIISTLATRKGELSDALSAAATDYKSKKTEFPTAKAAFLREARKYILEGGAGRDYGSSVRSQAQENPAAAEANRQQKLEKVAESYQSNPTLYSNAFFDPKLWKMLYDDMLKPLFGWTTEQAQDWKQNWKTTTSLYRDGKNKRTNPLEVMRFASNIIFRSEDGLMASLAARHKSPTITAIKDMLFAEGGVDRAIGTSYQEATERRIKTNLNKLGRILEPFGRSDEGKAKIARIVNLIENPDKIKAGRSQVDDAAIAISRLLTEERNYMVQSGLDVGLVEGGYFPAMYDTQAIIDNPAEFLNAATSAYERTYKTISRKEARDMAESWLHNIRLGDVFVSTKNNDFTSFAGSAPKPNSMKERVFTKEARDILRNKGFTVTDPVTALQMHFMRTAPKAEFNRRFSTEQWAEMKQQMIKEGAAEAIPHVVKIIKSSTGNAGFDVHPMVRKVESYARLMSVLEFLPRAAISSIHESAMAAVSTGEARAAVRAFNTAFKELFKASSNDEIREISEDIAGTTGEIASNMLMEQRTGGYMDGQFTRHIMQNFFKYTGLHHLTEAQRVAALESGQFMLRRLAADVTKGGNKHRSAEFFMQELGIPQEDAGGFAQWISNFTDGKPTKADLQQDGKYQQMYITALQRHVDRTIMNPNASTRPYLAKYPIVSLAYNLQSFIYAFSKNVLIRNARLVKEAASTGKDYTAADRIALVKPAIMMTIPFLMAGAVGELRDELYKDPAAKPKEKDKLSILARAASRFGIFGAADPYINMFTSLRYQKDPATALVGPLGGNISTAIKAFGSLLVRNSENTNTAERNAAKALYNLAVQPLLNGVSSLVPVPLAGAAAIQAASHPATREKFISALAGEKEERGGGERSQRGARRSSGRNNQRRSQR